MEEDEIIIEDFTKEYLNHTLPASQHSDLILPNFHQPISKGGVGCKIQRHYFNWTQITQDEMALEVVRNGYMPKFKEHPPLVSNPEPFEYNSTEIQKIAIDHEIQHFLENGVIEPVTDLTSPGFYSCVFVRPRSNDSPDRWRLIFDISTLNQHLIAPRFKMESPSTVRQFLKLNAFAVKLDLSDAFLHVPLHKSFRKYMRFFHRGIAYQFRSICFGANFSPYIFSYLINTVMKFFHKLSIDICAYLDDMLSQHLVPSTLVQQIHFVVQVMTSLGWTVNLNKSILDPRQLMDYIGLHISFTQGLVFPPQDRWEKIQLLCQEFLQKSQDTAQNWSKLLGLLTSCQDITPMGRLWLRPLQYQLNSYWINRRNLHTIIPISPNCKTAIKWWTVKEHVMPGVPWTHPDPEFTLYTDSSDLGWGGTMNNLQISGQWSTEMIHQHINVKELQATWEVMKHFLPQIQNHVVLIATDNSSVVCYLNRLGGTRSFTLMDLTVKILMWCQDNNITLRARHIPGRLNVLSDMLSRKGQIITTEWSLHPEIISQISQIWETPQVDLFATKHNHKLPLYYSPVPDPAALGVDCMSHPWSTMIAYAYPPQALIPQVLNKIKKDQASVFLIAPAWSSRSWYPTLLSLLVDFPRKLPVHKKLLKQPHTNMFHKNPAVLNLHVWKLSGNTLLAKDFQNKLPNASPTDVEQLQTNSMKPNGKSLCVGVINKKLIHAKLMKSN